MSELKEHYSDTQAIEEIVPKPFGEILKLQRMELSIAVSKVSSELRVKVRDIEAIERGDMACVMQHSYATGLIRAYARLLKIDDDVIQEGIKSLQIKSNTSNKNYNLINIGEEDEITPKHNSFMNVLVISIILFLALLIFYHSYEKNNISVTHSDLIEELENIESH